jgi:dTDP-glucose pyrophosphorylase
MKPTLLVLAAGMGNRYGGLKQVDPVGPHDEWIMDYAFYDALQAGFGKVVCVIRREIEQAFRERFTRILEKRVETLCVYQECDDADRAVRQKPWGTGHAVLCAREAITEPFAVINADDYYGPQAFRLIHDHLLTLATGQDRDYAMVGYRLNKTLSPHGTVCRGICTCDSGFLRQVRECCELQTLGQGISGAFEPGKPVDFTGEELVSLNLWGLGPDFFETLDAQFKAFHSRHRLDPRMEFYLPAAVDALIRSGATCVKVLPTEEQWFGVTYPADREAACAHIQNRIQAGMYPDKLWT